jgi:hypothetical protein
MNEDEPLVEEPRAALVECGLDDTRPNAAWEYAHRRPATRGWGIYSGAWLQSLDESPHFTTNPDEALCFNTMQEAKALGLRVMRHQIRNNIPIHVYVHRIPGGAK